MKLRPLQDWLMIKVEPLSDKLPSGLYAPDIHVANPVRLARVLAVGPGRRGRRRFIPTVVKPGDVVAFFMANLETKQGRQLCTMLEDDEGMIRETDILFVTSEDYRPQLSI